MDTLARAETLKEAAFGSSLDPLLLVRPGHPWYVKLDAMLPPEHYGVTTRLYERFRLNALGSGYLHIGLVGQGGTGKSTLVREAMASLRDIGILPVYVNSSESFDRSDMAFADVVLVLVEAVVRDLVERDETIVLEPARLERVRRWFAEEVVGETQARENRALCAAQIESGASAELSILLIANLASRVRGALRTHNDYRVEIRQKAARDPDELIAGANALLQAVNDALADRNQRICVVFDNLEKINDRAQVNNAILSRSEDLRRLLCHAIYFFSPADQYAPVDLQADQSFTYIEVPAIPVRQLRSDPPESVHPDALLAITRMLERRIATEKLFEDPQACIRAIMRWSGGRLRDVIELARQACEFADFDRSASQVSVAHVDRAAGKLAGRRLTAMTPDCWPRAREIHAEHTIANRPEDALMVRNSLVLAYDGDPWWDVHPFVASDGRFASGRA